MAARTYIVIKSNRQDKQKLEVFNNTEKVSLYLTENTLHLTYKHQAVNAVKGNDPG